MNGYLRPDQILDHLTLIKKGCPVHPWIILNSDNHVAHCIDPCLPSPSEITNNREKTRPNGLVGAASCNLDQVKGDEWGEVAKEKGV